MSKDNCWDSHAARHKIIFKQQRIIQMFFGLQNHHRWWLQPWNWKTLAPWKKSYDQPRQHIRKQRHYFANKGPSSQGYGFSSGHVWMWELDCNESWAPNNWCFWTAVLEEILESPLDCKEIQPVHPKGDQKLKLQYFGHLMRRTDSLEKTLMLRKTEEKGTTEDEMVGWHHQLNGHELE